MKKEIFEFDGLCCLNKKKMPNFGIKKRSLNLKDTKFWIDNI